MFVKRESIIRGNYRCTFRWTRGQKMRRLHAFPLSFNSYKTNKWEKKKITEMAESNQTQCIAMDSATALQQYLDHIPVSSISGIKSSVGNPPFLLFLLLMHTACLFFMFHRPYFSSQFWKSRLGTSLRMQYE